MNTPKLLTPARRAILLLLCCVLGLVAPVLAEGHAGPVKPLYPPDPGFTGYPNSIASAGDSITRAYNTGPTPFTDYPANAWSTGTNSQINSQYLRILASNPAISGHAYNAAVSGAKMADLNAQVTTINAQQADYVTLLMGGNDACTASESAMTPVATYSAQFQTALNTLSAGSPHARIFVLSVPSLYRLWFVLKDNASARFAWSTFGICQSMLANPLSTAQTDVDRRNRVNQRVMDYNAQLAAICALYIHCRFDNNLVYNHEFVASEISTRDYFHPSITGQTNFATFSYPATFDFTDKVAPVTHAVLSVPMMRGLLVALSASDDVAVAGIEYKLNAGAYVRYSVPVTVPAGSQFTYRAVDVNGNIEAAQVLLAP